MNRGYDSICCFRNRHEDGYRILLEITNRCNENCVFCHAKDKNELSLEDIKTIIDNLGGIKIHDVILTGGEPVLHRELLDILDWFKQQGIECDLCSNGTLIDEEFANKLHSYLTEISISLDTVNPSVYDALRGTKNGLEKVLTGIKKLQKAGIDVHLTNVLTKENYEEIENVIQMAQALKVHSISFLAVITDIAKNKDYTEEIALSKEEKARAMEIIKQYRETSDNLIINTKRMCECMGERCRAGENILGITSEGKLLGCIMHREKEFDILHSGLSEELVLELQKNTIRC